MIAPMTVTQIEAKATQFLQSKLHGNYAKASITEAKYVAIPFWRVMVWAGAVLLLLFLGAFPGFALTLGGGLLTFGAVLLFRALSLGRGKETAE